jgi:hypothetical protein
MERGRDDMTVVRTFPQQERTPGQLDRTAPGATEPASRSERDDVTPSTAHPSDGELLEWYAF